MGCASATQLGQGTATNPGITAQDLRARLYAFADDSMMGRQFGTEGNRKAAQYNANDLAGVGGQPGRAGGSYFQDVPAYRVSLAPASQVLFDGAPLVVGTDYITNFPGSGRAIQVDSVQVVYGGDLSDTTTLLPAEQAAGRAVLLTIRTPLQRNPGPILARYAAARTIITANDPRAVRPYAVTRSTDTTPARLNLVGCPPLAPRPLGGDPATARRDSIYNGADDDGSGSVGALESAEAFARSGVKPRRSLIFVWHTGEEAGLLGSRYFADNPTVPRDSIVAQLNMDMIGRGGAFDFVGGGPTYLQLVGSRRLSTELGAIVEAVNRAEPTPLSFDYSFDANGHPERIYCRSDHYNYARYGIPIAFFTTGLHMDYHQLTDEPQYIDYEHMRKVAQLVHDVALSVGNLDHRLVVAKPKPDPPGACEQ